MSSPAMRQKQDDVTQTLRAAPGYSPATADKADLRSIAATTGKSPFAVLQDFARLALAPGRISFRDYVDLRLFDETFWAGAERRKVAGRRRNRDLDLEINWRHDWYGLLSNKAAQAAYLAAHGLPTIPVRALHVPGMTRTGPGHLPTREALRDFLLDADNHPLFGKPLEANRSHGAIAMLGCDRAAGTLCLADGSEVGVDSILDRLGTLHDGDGYLFQALVRPHAAIAAMAGPALSTARIVTLAGQDGPQVFRVCWKIGSAGNIADNFWRPGNLLASVDRETGTIGPVVTGVGHACREVTHHPDTGTALAGARLPDFSEMVAIALEGARLMRHVPLIGWDMAATETGPVIVEMNETPDLFLNQFADRRGIMDETFTTCLEFQRRRAGEHERRMKQDIARL